MGKFNEIAEAIKAESTLPPGKRTQNVPCAYCSRGGNGDMSCACGMDERRYSRYKGCFAGTMLDRLS